MTVIDIRTRQPVTNIAERSRAHSAATPGDGAPCLAVGCTLENGTLRTQRYSDHLVLWDLTNAGKRGKKVAKLNLCPSYTVNAAQRDALMEQIALLLEGLQSYAVAAAALSQLASASKLLDLRMGEERGVDVAPMEFKTITIKTAILDLTASYKDFSINCLTDENNRPSACPRPKNARKAIQQFYAWVSVNQGHINAMSYREVLSAMLEQGIQYHAYCGMD